MLFSMNELYRFDAPDSVSNISFKDIHQAFSESSHGIHLGGKTRWDTFKPPHFSNKEWINLLGIDVNNLEHIYLTLRSTQAFLHGCANPHLGWQGEVPEAARFTPEERLLLCIGAVEHDWGEAIVGDIPQPLKTDAHEKKEKIALQSIISEFCSSEPFCDLQPFMHEAMDRVVFSRETKEGRAFHAIEQAGYIRTGLNAWERRGHKDENVASRLTELASKCIPSHLPSLQKYAEDYPPIHHFLSHPRNDRLINEILLSTQG